MDLPIWYDRQGQPITTDQWTAFRQDSRYRTVAVTARHGLLVSTVWLGLDHGLGQGRPVIFETMVFTEGSWTDWACDRYTTEAAAITGHQAILDRLDASGWDPAGLEADQ